jgi:hypothetical protein
MNILPLTKLLNAHLFPKGINKSKPIWPFLNSELSSERFSPLRETFHLNFSESHLKYLCREEAKPKVS